jgi:hypothetical protein
LKANANSTARVVLSALALKVNLSKEDLYGQAIGMAFYGLQGMSSDCAEGRAVLSALATKLLASKNNLSSQEIGNTFYGLQGLGWILFQ